MRICRQIALLCAVVLLGTMAAPARSAPLGFTDEFAALDASRHVRPPRRLERVLDGTRVVGAGRHPERAERARELGILGQGRLR